MKPINYPGNGNGLFYQYHRMREGPNYFLCAYKQSSVLRQDPKDAWRVLGPAKFTDASKELKEWCLEMHQLYVLDKQTDKQGRADTSFASEAMAEQAECNEALEPNDNTKMIV